MERFFFVLGALFAFIGVAAGAFGAHDLKSQLSADMLSVFEVGVRYQMYHAFALIATAFLQSRRPSMMVIVGGWLFTANIVLFSGSLYLLSFGGPRWFGAITPLGGVAFLVGWLCLALAAETAWVTRGLYPQVTCSG